MYKGQTAQDIEANCSDDNPCLVYWAWKLCKTKAPVKLTLPTQPVLASVLSTPTYAAVRVGLSDYTIQPKLASDYLRDAEWADCLVSCIKGLGNGVAPIDSEMFERADSLVS